MPKKQIESGIKKAVKQYLEWYKWYVITIQGSPFGTHGISDLIAIRDGRVLFLEIKTESGKESVAQKCFGQQIKNHGGEYHVIRSVDSLIHYGVI